ncbi:unnamed protein product [Protopolystoma xenopodis]|uniref:TANGO6 N-terminal domain-containing protein n=1 Tax=Protopolystoma xenopodis TaxID=117903 RepID=A0A448XF75_9PLAT|nr:unnamed protein product [Protopolystoma xenopodis]
MYLGDLLAALFQVAYGSRVSSDSKVICEARKLLLSLLSTLPKHHAMQQLLILQGGRPQSNKNAPLSKVKMSPSPPWLRRACGRLLSYLLVSPPSGSSGVVNSSHAPSPEAPNGIASLILAVMACCGAGSLEGSSSCHNPKQTPYLITSLAHLLSRPPFQPASKREQEKNSYFLLSDCDPGSNNLVDCGANKPSDKWINDYFKCISDQFSALVMSYINALLVADPVSSNTPIHLAYPIFIATTHEVCRVFPTSGLLHFISPFFTDIDQLYSCCRHFLHNGL